MYLHLGESTSVKKSSIVGIFDSDMTTVSKVTKKFLSDAEKKKRLEIVGDLPKSFIVTSDKKGERIYFSQLSSKTLSGRAGSDESNERK